MKKLGILLYVLGTISFLLGLRTCLREYSYLQASEVVAAEVFSVETEPVKSTVTRVNYRLTYSRDNKIDTVFFSTPINHTDANPLPGIEQLKAEKKYVRYVPSDKQHETAYCDHVYANDTGKYEGTFGLSSFIRMAVLLFIGYLMRK